jgi:hypothetical protein
VRLLAAVARALGELSVAMREKQPFTASDLHERLPELGALSKRLHSRWCVVSRWWSVIFRLDQPDYAAASAPERIPQDRG